MKTNNPAPTAATMSLQDMAPLIQDGVQQGQEVVLTITGNSMTPFLRHGRDQVVLVQAQPDTLQPGQVPLYRRRNGQYVLHRIVERDDGTSRRRLGDREDLPAAHVGAPLSYTMLGDAQTELEPRIEADQIIAVATAFLKGGKRRECHTRGYHLRVLWWHRLLPVRSGLMRVYRMPGWLRAMPGRVYRKIKRSLVR